MPCAPVACRLPGPDAARGWGRPAPAQGVRSAAARSAVRSSTAARRNPQQPTAVPGAASSTQHLDRCAQPALRDHRACPGVIRGPSAAPGASRCQTLRCAQGDNLFDLSRRHPVCSHCHPVWPSCHPSRLSSNWTRLLSFATVIPLGPAAVLPDCHPVGLGCRPSRLSSCSARLSPFQAVIQLGPAAVFPAVILSNAKDLSGDRLRICGPSAPCLPASRPATPSLARRSWAHKRRSPCAALGASP